MARILRRPAVEEKTGLPTSTLYLRLQQGRFPAPISLGAPGGAVGWLEEEVDQWIADQARSARREQQPIVATA
ncbi:MAG: AlpA family phage regulatory protein [Gemmatimonadota bacterium]|nr:AlpA family phage regulatory protein [Gemmatimonadota bacterium]